MKIIRNILMICFSLLIYHPLYGKCSNLQIGNMIKMGLSEEEITEVCGKPTIKSEDKTKPVVKNLNQLLKNLNQLLKNPK